MFSQYTLQKVQHYEWQGVHTALKEQITDNEVYDKSRKDV